MVAVTGGSVASNLESILEFAGGVVEISMLWAVLVGIWLGINCDGVYIKPHNVQQYKALKIVIRSPG